MCKICDKTYDNNTTELSCCRNVTEIPVLPKLEILYCDNTKITKIPVLPELKKLNCYNTNIIKIQLLPKLEILYCYNTKITEIPVLPELKELWCSNTSITEIPKIPNCLIEANNCVWLSPSAYRINKLGKLQKWTRSIINKRTKIIHAAMYTYRDLVYVLNV